MSFSANLQLEIQDYDRGRIEEITRAVHAVLEHEQIDDDMCLLQESWENFRPSLFTITDQPIIFRGGSFDWIDRIEAKLAEVVTEANGGPCRVRFFPFGGDIEDEFNAEFSDDEEEGVGGENAAAASVKPPPQTAQFPGSGESVAENLAERRPQTVTVKVNRQESSGNLPMVCMRCGEPATVMKEREFHARKLHHRHGIFFLIEIIAWLGSSMVTVRAPFCSIHQNQWQQPRVAIWILAGFVGFMVVGIFAIAITEPDPSSILIVIGIGVLIAVGLLLLTTLYIFWHGRQGVIVAQITRDYVVFDHVHCRFLEALEAQRNSGARVDRE